MSNPVESSSHNCVVCGMYTLSLTGVCDMCAEQELADALAIMLREELDNDDWKMMQDEDYYSDPYEGWEPPEYPW